MKSLVLTRSVPQWLKFRDVHFFEHQAMATLFGIYISHPDSVYASQAAFACFGELERLEQELSRFLPNSDVSRIRQLKGGEDATVSLDTFHCLEIARKVHKETRGAFDVTLGALVDYWKSKKSRNENSAGETRYQIPVIGVNKMRLNKKEYKVRSLQEGLNLDLGGIGKGYALDRMAVILKEWGLDHVLLHSGFSTVLAVAAPSNEAGWPVSLTHPQKKKKITLLTLRNGAVSGSGRQKGDHIIDPGSGSPVKDHLAAWVLAPTAVRADALSTAFMVMSMKEIRKYCIQHKSVSAYILKDKTQNILFL